MFLGLGEGQHTAGLALHTAIQFKEQQSGRDSTIGQTEVAQKLVFGDRGGAERRKNFAVQGEGVEGFGGRCGAWFCGCGGR